MTWTLVERKIKADDVIDKLFNLFVFRGIPDHVRPDNGRNLLPEQSENG